jgi:glycine dehydrogenase
LSEFLDEIRVGSTQVGQAGIACIPWMFITMLGSAGLRRSAEIAIANANYMVARLKGFYEMPFLNSQSRCSHEFIIDVAPIRESAGVTEEDIAKRLMDYGFHAPTMSWPVHASLMIEPTESESIDELDRFCDAMISIRDEIKRIETGEWDRLDNPLKNAPHTEAAVTSSNWTHTYSRETAAFPLEYIRTRGKFWPSVGRVSNSYGDKNLILNIEN